MSQDADVPKPTSSHWRDGLLLKITNVAAYFLLLGSNVYAVASPQSAYYNIKQTYLTPASWFFFVWSVTHVFLLGTVIYQFTSAHAKAVIIDGISWNFPILVIFNITLVTFWAHHYYFAAFVFSVLSSLFVTQIYLTVKKEYSPKSIGDELFVNLPFGLWNGWATVLIFLTAFEAFGVNADKHPPGLGTQVCVFFALLTLKSNGVAYALSSTEGDLPGAVVISLALWAIFDHQRTPFIHWSALAFAIPSLFWVVQGFWRAWRKQTGDGLAVTDEERGPLLGESQS